jgi:hypothetical protein
MSLPGFLSNSTDASFQLSSHKTSPITVVRGAFSRLARALPTVSLVIVGTLSAQIALAQSVTFNGSQAVNFGSVNVCPSGQTTPAPCSKTLTLTYKVTASGTLGAPLVLTGASPGEDVTLASGTTCTGAVTEGSTCAVNVTFAPRAPGARNGGVEIVDGSGNVLANTYIYGTGVGPAIAFNPGTYQVLSSNSSFDLEPTLAMTVDAGGNLFFLWYPYNTLIEMKAVNGSIPPNAGMIVLASNLPVNVAAGSGLAVDGSGNLFVAVNNGTVTETEPPNSPVTEIVAAGGYTTFKSIGTPGTFFTAIDVDGSGNLFVADSNVGTIKEILAVNGGIPVNPTTKTLVTGFVGLSGVAVDRSGNVFFDDSFNNEVKEILAVNGSIPTNPTINTLGSGFTRPSGVAVEASGNVIVTDDVGIKEILAEGGYTKVITLYSSGSSYYIAVDGSGNVFYPYFEYFPDGPPGEPTSDTLYIIGINELQRSQRLVFHFLETHIGLTSEDSPQSAQIQNIGNAKLIGTVTSVSPNWDLVAGSGTPEDCPPSFSLAPGTEYNLSISFAPKEAGPLAGAVSLEDNALNVSRAMQSIGLIGIGDQPSPQITSVSATYGAPYANITLTGTNFGPTGFGIVYFSGMQAQVLSWSGTRITAVVPNGALSGTIYVFAPFSYPNQLSNKVAFTVVPRPSVTGISPTNGPIGTIVTISGQNLLDAQGNGSVWLYNTRLPIVSQSSTSIQVTIPTGAVSGVIDVHVNGVGGATPVFTVSGAPAKPQLTGLSANYGALYAIVSLHGTGFGALQGSSTVTFNGIAATASTFTNTAITVTVPYRAATGNVIVTVAGQPSNGIPFSVEPTPSLTGMSPTSGPAGILVTISGHNLLDAEGHGSVWFGNVNALIVSQSSTSIQVKVPVGATTGPIDAHVNGVGNYTPGFTVTN